MSNSSEETIDEKYIKKCTYPVYFSGVTWYKFFLIEYSIDSIPTFTYIKKCKLIPSLFEWRFKTKIIKYRKTCALCDEEWRDTKTLEEVPYADCKVLNEWYAQYKFAQKIKKDFNSTGSNI